MEPSSEDKVVVHELQIKDILEDNEVIIVPKDTGGQVKSLQPKQMPIDPVEQGKSAKDPPLEHIFQDGEEKEDMLLLHEFYSLANSTLETCALEAILMIGPSLAD